MSGLTNGVSEYVANQISSKYDQSDSTGRALGQLSNGFVNSVMDKLFSTISSAAKAEKDEQEHAKVIENANKRAEEIEKISDEKLREAVKNIDEQTEKIREIIEQAEELLQAKFKEEQEEITKIQEEITKEVEALNNCDSEEEKQAVLDRIRGLGDQIVIKAGEINNEISEKIAESQANVMVCTKLITENINDAAQTITENLKNVEGIQVSTQAEVSQNMAKDTASGTKEAAEAAAAQAKATGGFLGAIFTFGASGLLGGAEEAKAIDLAKASETHFGSSASQMVQLGAALGKMSGISAQMSYDITMVGEAGMTAAGLVGDFETKVADTIVSIGSINESTGEVNEKLQEAVGEYEKDMASENGDEEDKKDNGNSGARNILAEANFEKEIDFDKLV